jgi:hypothetical protein
LLWRVGVAPIGCTSLVWPWSLGDQCPGLLFVCLFECYVGLSYLLSLSQIGA